MRRDFDTLLEGIQGPSDSPHIPQPSPLPPGPATPSMDFRYYEIVENEDARKARLELGMRQWQPREPQLDNPFW